MTTGMDGSDNGLVFRSGSDTGAGGLWALRYNPGYRATVRWNSNESDVIVLFNGEGRAKAARPSFLLDRRQARC
jgi:hypothetical protein